MKKITILLILLNISFYSFSQELDKVYLKNKEVVSGKILQVTSENIEINPKGSKPFLMIKRSDVNIIIYSDNTIVNFNEKISSSINENKSNTNNNQFLPKITINSPDDLKPITVEVENTKSDVLLKRGYDYLVKELGNYSNYDIERGNDQIILSFSEPQVILLLQGHIVNSKVYMKGKLEFHFRDNRYQFSISELEFYSLETHTSVSSNLRPQDLFNKKGQIKYNMKLLIYPLEVYLNSHLEEFHNAVSH